MDDDQLIDVLLRAAVAAGSTVGPGSDWTPSGGHPGQHRADVVADAAGLQVLRAAGLDVLSEESGFHGGGAGVVVVFDPVDGSSNAARGVPWFNTSLCALDRRGPRAAVVLDLVRGVRYQALRGHGSFRDGVACTPSGCRKLSRAIVGLSGYPARHLGWRQYRALGATALDLCLVADGSLDAFCDCSDAGLGPWDYLGGALVCTEAGAAVGELSGLDISGLEISSEGIPGLDISGARFSGAINSSRRRPVAAATPELLERLVSAARGGGVTGSP